MSFNPIYLWHVALTVLLFTWQVFFVSSVKYLKLEAWVPRQIYFCSECSGSPVRMWSFHTVCQEMKANEKKWPHCLTDWPCDYLYGRQMTPALCITPSIFQSLIPKQNSIRRAVTFFMWFMPLSWVPHPLFPPPPHPLSVSSDNPSLCLWNEKQHSSRGMTSSVSTGAGTEDATLPVDWTPPDVVPGAVCPVLFSGLNHSLLFSRERKQTV